MSNKPDWTGWILQKNIETNIEELKKASAVTTQCLGCNKDIVSPGGKSKRCLPCSKAFIATQVAERAQKKQDMKDKLTRLRAKHPELNAPIPGEKENRENPFANRRPKDEE